MINYSKLKLYEYFPSATVAQWRKSISKRLELILIPSKFINSQRVSFDSTILHLVSRQVSRKRDHAFHASPTDPSHNSRIASPLSPFKNNVENRVHCSASLFHSGRVAMSCSVNRWYFFSVRETKSLRFSFFFAEKKKKKKLKREWTENRERNLT